MRPSNLVTTARAACWTAVTLRRTRRSLALRGLEGARATPPPDLPGNARRGVVLALRGLRGTCLERALLLQSWEAAHGAGADVVIGVTGPSEGFRAHAWLDSASGDALEVYTEIVRIPAPPAT